MKFITDNFLFFVPGANESSLCCHFVSRLNKQRRKSKMTLKSGLNQWNE